MVLHIWCFCPFTDGAEFVSLAESATVSVDNSEMMAKISNPSKKEKNRENFNQTIAFVSTKQG